jgi:glycosyltransferase involved in cell wall biosynthesis
MKSIGIFAINTWDGGGATSINNLSQIFRPIFKDIILVTTLDQNESLSPQVANAENVSYRIVNHKGGGNKFSRIFNTIWSQIRISYNLLRIIRKTDAFLFLGELLVLPMIIAKICGKETFLSLPSSQVQMSIAIGDIFSRELQYISKMAFLISSFIVLYTPNLINEWSLEEYKDKIVFAHEQYIDFTKFHKTKEIDDRKNLIGYMGRLSPEKGIENFVKAITLLSKDMDDLNFLIIGDGKLMSEIKLYTKENDLDINTTILGRVDHDELPKYLNELKMLVIPSYTEGLPNIMLESMACGTPVLATSVGGIPDIITDSQNGFILTDNSPQTIAEGVKKVLKYPEKDEISMESEKTVKKYFNYETVVKQWSDIFQ